jgi:uncharacterized protein (DUF58 family)
MADDKPEAIERVRTLDPKVLAEAGNLAFKARIVADSVLHGMHRSRHHGSSVEFSDHKEYSPGDNIRHLDWRAFARFDRDYVKRFEDESHLRALMLVDTSGSMAYRGSTQESASKLDFASICAGALAYVLGRQGDAVGLATFDGALSLRVPTRARRGHLQEILTNIEQLEPSGPTALAPALDALAEGIGRRTIVVILSDLLEAGPGAIEAIAKLGARRHDVVLFHVMHPDELDFPFEESTLFVSMEDAREVQIDARSIRSAYLDEVGRFLQHVETTANAARVEYHLVRSDTNPSDHLTRFLARRSSMRASAK